MTENTHSNHLKQDLEHRLRDLEEQSRFTLDILEMASSLGDFQTQINMLHEPSDIFMETSQRICGFVPFQTTGFYLVNEETQDFEFCLCLPHDKQRYLDSEVEALIDTGVFPLAVRENRPIIVYSSDMSRRLVLHVLATNSRTRGMFIGILERKGPSVSGLLLSLLSIILKNCANAVESFELYRLFKSSGNANYTALDTLPLPVFTLSSDGGIIQANRLFRSFFKIPELGSIPHFDALIEAQDVPRLHKHLEQLLPGEPCPPIKISCNSAGGGRLWFLHCIMAETSGNQREYTCQAVPVL